MNHFEEFSRDINNIAKLHSVSRLVRLFCRLEYWWCRYWADEPLPFLMVENEGRRVGEPMDVRHLSLPDMMERKARDRLTAEVLLKGLRVNAFSCEAYKQAGETAGMTTIQPRWVEP